MQKIIYINSLSFSGSTIMDLVLGLHPQITGLGELYQFLIQRPVNFNTYKCTCGNLLKDCPFWADYQKIYNLELNNDLDFITKYENFIDYFQSKKGKKQIIVDSSKHQTALKKLYKLSTFGKIDLKVIFLLRDVRAFSLSRKYHRSKNNKWNNLLESQLRWWYINKISKCFLDNNEIDYLQIGYEELCFYPKYILNKICKFIGVNFSDKLLDSPAETGSHTARGNPMRVSKKKRKKIMYDSRWLRNRKVSLVYSLLPFVAKWNSKNVYSNTKNFFV